MSENADWFVVCPTCRFIEDIEAFEDERAERPCPNCGWTLMVVKFTEWDGVGYELAVRWTEDACAPLFLDDVQKAIARVDAEYEKEGQREDRLTAMRIARQEQEEEV